MNQRDNINHIHTYINKKYFTFARILTTKTQEKLNITYTEFDVMGFILSKYTMQTKCGKL